jgi:hypothetical protein
MPYGQNLTIQDGQVRKRNGYTLLGTSTATGTATASSTNVPLDSDILGLYQYRLYDGTEFLTAMTQDKAYYYDSTNNYWTTFTGTGTFTGDDSNFFYIDEIRKTGESDPWLVFTNNNDFVQYWTGTGTHETLVSTGTEAANLKAKYLLQFKNYLVLFNTEEGGVNNPKRVRWSDTALPDTFSGGNSSFLDLSGPSEITGAIRYQNDFMAISRKDSLWTAYATGDDNIFQFEQKSKHGCPAGRTMVNIGQSILYMGYDDVYEFNGIESVSIGWPIREDFFTNELDQAAIGRCFAFDVPDMKEYWLVFPTTDGKNDDTPVDAADRNKLVWVYNYERGKWVSRHKMANSIMCNGQYTNQTTTTIGDLIGTIGDQSQTIGSYQTGGETKFKALGDSGGYVYSISRGHLDNATAIDAEFETKDFIIDDESTNIRVLRLDVFWEGTGMDVAYSTDRGGSWQTLTTLTTQSGINRSTIHMRAIGEIFRFRFKNNTSGQFFKFDKAVAYWQPAGDRT